MSILITGASGTVGRAVFTEISKTSLPFRAMYRTASEVPPGVNSVLADFASRESMNRALEGIDCVFLVCGPIPQLIELESNAIDACVEAGVKHVVLNSALGAADYPKSFPSWHRRVEEKLKSSGLSWTILRPNSFMQNILAYFAPSIRAEGAFYQAMGAARVSFIDVRDVAARAAEILASPEKHAAKIYELNGPEAVTYTQLAERISRVSGRNVRFIDISMDAQRKSLLGLGMPQWQVDALLDLQQYYVGGQGAEIGDAPTKLDNFLQDFKDSFQAVNPKTGMTHAEMKQFVRDHFEQFVNRKNLDIAYKNFAPEFVDHGSDVPPGMPPGPEGAKQYVGAALAKFPAMRVEILDLMAEDDKVVVRNRWTTGVGEFSGIVIWRIANRQLVERWAYLK